MPSLLPGFEYDVFISYRQNDNRSGWVTQFVEELREELAATIKEPVNVYFDENPHDGLQDTHQVDKSLEGKLRCLVFLPILSRTYCDERSFAWNNEFLAFCDMFREGTSGMGIRLPNGNYASRILPVQVHDINPRDQRLFEEASGSPLRSIDFIFRSSGVNRPLMREDVRGENLEKTVYRDQLNKTANAIDEILNASMLPAKVAKVEESTTERTYADRNAGNFWKELVRRNVFRAAIAYLIVSLAVQQAAVLATKFFDIQQRTLSLLPWMLVGFFPVAMTLAWLYEVSPDGWIRTTSTKSTKNPYRPSRKKPFTSLGVMLTLVILLVIQYFFFKYFNIDGEARKSIAVLNFVDQSDEKKDVYFADALTNDIIDRLCMIRELRVISPLSSRTYKNTNASIVTIASELNVSSILSGTVRRKGETTNISVRLTDGQGAIRWSHPYNIKSSGILDIHAEIAIQISRILEIELDDSELDLLNRKPTWNLTAWDYYQKGIRLYSYHRSDSNDLAIEQFKKALALDPNYSLAWSGLADAYSQLQFRAAREIHWLDSSRASAKRALELDTNSAEAYKALANPYFYWKRYDTAFVLLKKAVEKNPKNVPSTNNLGTVYLVQADLVNALSLFKRAASLSPRSAIPFQAAGWTYRLLGDLPEAEMWLNSSIDRNSSLWDTYRELGFTYCFEGKRQKALDLVPKMLELGKRDARTLEIAGRIALFADDQVSAKEYFLESIEKNPNYNTDAASQSSIGLGAIFLHEGDKIQAEVYLTQALNVNLEQIEKGLKDDDYPYNVAAIYAIQGKKKESLQWLGKAIEYHWVDYNHVESGPYFAKLAGDPDMARILKGVQSRIDSMRNSLPRD